MAVLQGIPYIKGYRFSPPACQKAGGSHSPSDDEGGESSDQSVQKAGPNWLHRMFITVCDGADLKNKLMGVMV